MGAVTSSPVGKGKIAPTESSSKKSLKKESSFMTATSNSTDNNLNNFMRSSGSDKEISFRYGFLSSTSPSKVMFNDLISQRVWLGERQCQEDRKLRQAFVKYILSLRWMETITLLIHQQLQRRVKGHETSEVMFGEYSMGRRSRSNSKVLENRDSDSISARASIYTQLKIRDALISEAIKQRNGSGVTCFSFDQMQDIVLTTLWPLFLDSDAYNIYYLNMENSVTFSATVSAFENEPASVKISTEGYSKPDFERIERLRRFYKGTVDAMTLDHIDSRLRSGRWVKNTIKAFEDNQLPVSIGGARSATRGFPLIFVNRAFERMTQWERSEAIGQKCTFLQCGRSESEQLERLSNALAKGLGVKVAITNARKDGSEFTNFLALKPVFDKHENYLFVCGVQYDITRADASLQEIKTSEDFLAILCNTLRG
jgi:PAS domain S-box-containing protein